MKKYLFTILLVGFCFGQLDSSAVLINEFLAGSEACCGTEIFNGNAEDFVELYNNGTDTVNISGWGFSDTDGIITTTAPDTSIAPGDFLVLWYTGDNNGFPEVNEVFFDDVRVPAENLIGEENKGWTYAKVLLTHERTNIAGVPRGKRRLKALKNIAAETDDGFGGKMIDSASFKHRLAEVEIELKALEYSELRTLAALSVGKAPGPESSILKIVGTELAQRMDEMFVELAGYNCLPFVPEQFEPGFAGEPIGPGNSASAALTYFNNRKLSIFGGSNEIQRNIISKAVLGL